MPRRRPVRRSVRPASSGPDAFDFEWLMLPWDALVAAPGAIWRTLAGGVKAVWEALRTQRAARYFVLLFLAALVIRLWRPDWYLQNTFHPDERWIFDKVSALSWPGEPGKDDGAGLQYGSLPMYAVGAAKDVAVHVFHSDAYSAVMQWGRTLTGCVDALTVLATYLLAVQLVGSMPALLAALFIACAPLNILFAHFFTVDPWLACFATFSLAVEVRLARRPSLKGSACLGVLYAAALASKTSGLPLALPIVVAHLWPVLSPDIAPDERIARLKRCGLGLLTAVGATLAAFFVFMPWAILDFHKFYDNQTSQSAMLVAGSPMGTPFVRQYWDTGFFFHVKNVCLFYLGLPTGLLAVLAMPLMGGVAALKAWRAWSGPSAPRARATDAASASMASGWDEVLGPLLLLSWLVPYISIVSCSFAKFARYMLPALPALAVLLVCALVWLRQRSARGAWILTALCFLFSLGYGTGYFFTYLHQQPWRETSAWTYANIPATVADATVPGGMRQTRILNEDWGDDLPVPINGHFNNYNNLKDQPGQVNIVEWDSADKLARFNTSLSQTDVIFLADPRGYGTYLRIPHRFPLTNAYYTLLFTNPAELGFALTHESSNPIKLFGLFPVPDSRIPSVPLWRWADESFTLYDRPHAYVFQRVAPRTPDQIRAVLLAEVQTLHLSTAFMTGSAPDQLQAAFDGQVLQPTDATPPGDEAVPAGTLNRNFGLSRGLLTPLGYPPLIWWFLVTVLGLLALPLCTRIFQGFPAGGYALSRALGVFLFAWLAYNLALLFPGLLPFWQSRLWLVLAAGAVGVTYAVRRRRSEAAAWFKANRAEILFTEAVFAAAFLFFTLVRAYNPNIHDVVGQGYFGGGEPLGMTYLSAVTRCATFPAYDPWLTLANSSYYYFGYVLAGTLTKLSGIAPAITYNLSLALFFSLTVLSAFGLLRALVSKRWLALGGAAMVALSGTLWTVAYIALQGSQGTGWLTAWFSHGFIWDPTRFPDLVNGHIFEFPFFSYLYGDLHPHNIILGFSIMLAALYLKPFLSRESGWRSLGNSPMNASLWLLVVALLLDAQYAINTWSWPIYVALGAACLLVGPWAGKGLGARPAQVLGWAMAFGLIGLGAAIMIGNIGVLAGIPGWAGASISLLGLAALVPLYLVGGGMASLTDFLLSVLALLVVLIAGRVLMYGFRHYYLQNGANRAGRVQPSEWQMSTYIPMAYYLPGLMSLAVLAGMRLNAWGRSLAGPLGWSKLKREDEFDKALILGERYFGRFPLGAMGLCFAALVIGYLIIGATVHWQTQGVWAVGLSLGLSCLCLFMLGGFSTGSEAYLWVLGGCFCLMFCGTEFIYVADRMNTIFKVWMNGWILMALVFGAGFATAFDQAPAPEAQPVKSRKAKPRRVNPAVLFPILFALGLVLLVALSAGADARLMNRNGRFFVSYMVFGLCLLTALALGAFYGTSQWWRWARQGLFFGLLAMGLLYPVGAVGRRIWETSQFKDPHLDGLSFMAQRDSRPGPYDADYDRHDYALITWLNENAPVTETVVETPGMDLYKGYNRFSIYTGLPTLLGWSYQVGQQLGERTGDILGQRLRDAAIIYGPDDAAAIALLKHYHARWIVVGSLERKTYAAPGLDKFKHLAAVAFQDGPSVLYRFDWDKP